MPIVVEGFPDDGIVRVVRWLDHVSPNHGATSSPGVRVLLQRLGPAEEILAVPAFSRALVGSECRPEFDTAEVLVGLVPALAIGTAFTGREAKGRLPAEHERRRFRLADVRATLCRASDGNPAPRPPGWGPGYPWKVLGPSAYALGPGFADGWCVVLDGTERGRAVQVVIPCCEVFRSFYGRTSRFALAFTTDLAPEAMPRLLNLPRCHVRDGVWQVGLRKEVADEHAPLLGTLALTAHGARAANTLLERPPGEGAPMRFASAFPFEAPTLDLTARCVGLRPEGGRWLAHELLSFAWPEGHFGPSGKLDVARDNSGEPGQVIEEVEGPPPYVYRPVRFRHQPGGRVPVGDGEDPAPGEPAPLEAPIPWFSNPPRLEHVEKPTSKRYVPPPPDTAAKEVDRASGGNEGPRKSESARVEVRQDPPSKPRSRFARLRDALDALKATKECEPIASWSVERPPAPLSAFADGLEVWRMRAPAGKSPKGWAAMPATGAPRQALVVSVALPGRPGLVHLVEAQEDPGTTGRGPPALVCMLPESGGQRTADRLLSTLVAGERQGLRVVRKAGAWPKAVEIEARGLAVRALLWRHEYDRHGALNVTSLARAIRAVAGA